jgi:hypothetical protein
MTEGRDLIGRAPPLTDLFASAGSSIFVAAMPHGRNVLRPG